MVIVHVPSVEPTLAGIVPPDKPIACVPAVAVSTPVVATGPFASAHEYVAAPDIRSPFGHVPGRLLLKATPVIGEDALVFDSVIWSCVV